MILRSVKDVRKWRGDSSGSVGFVPTMGALHNGHQSLIEQSAQNNDRTVVSLFVNPTQFNDPDDLAKYPRTEEADTTFSLNAGASAVFIPSADEIYRDQFLYEVCEKATSNRLCGPFRPGHFTGVMTVVLKLFNIVNPTRAYFGEKDFQQLRLIEGLAHAFFLPIEIVGCPTVRESDGLALSSRNRRLSDANRELGAAIARILRKSPDTAVARQELEDLGFRVDYVEDLWNRRFAAVHAGQVRLIDNVEL